MEKESVFKQFIDYIGGIEVWKKLYENNRLGKEINKRKNNYGSGANCNYKGLEIRDMKHSVMIYDDRKDINDDNFYNIEYTDRVFVAIRLNDDEFEKDVFKWACRVYNFTKDSINTCRHGRPLFNGPFTAKFKYNLESKEGPDYLYGPLMNIKKYLENEI